LVRDIQVDLQIGMLVFLWERIVQVKGRVLSTVLYFRPYSNRDIRLSCSYQKLLLGRVYYIYIILYIYSMTIHIPNFFVTNKI
jgi:hypothetical protein